MRFQAKLTTKLEEFSVGDAVIELNNDIDSNNLNEIVKSLLQNQDEYDEKKLGNRAFDFLVGDRLLRLNVEEHLKLYSDEIDVNELLSEKVVEVEYLFALEPPKPLEAVQQDDWVSCVDSNDSYIITGSYDNSVRLYSIADRKLLHTIENAHERPVSKVKFVSNPVGSKKNDIYFVSCGHDEVSILRRLNTRSRKVDIVFTYRGHNRSVNCVDVSDELIATGSFDKTIRLWSAGLEDQGEMDGDEDDEKALTKSAKKQKIKTSETSVSKTSRGAIMTFTGHHESVTGVRWLGDCNEYKSVASCSLDRSICIWDVEVGECKRRLHSTKPLLGIDHCPRRNMIISASCDRFVRLWDARAPDNSKAKAAYTSHSAWISNVAFGRSTDNYFISGGFDNMVKLWDLRSPKACLYDLIGHHDKVLDVNWSNPDYVLSGSADSTLKIFATKKL